MKCLAILTVPAEGGFASVAVAALALLAQSDAPTARTYWRATRIEDVAPVSIPAGLRKEAEQAISPKSSGLKFSYEVYADATGWNQTVAYRDYLSPALSALGPVEVSAFGELLSFVAVDAKNRLCLFDSSGRHVVIRDDSTELSFADIRATWLWSPSQVEYLCKVDSGRNNPEQYLVDGRLNVVREVPFAQAPTNVEYFFSANRSSSGGVAPWETGVLFSSDGESRAITSADATRVDIEGKLVLTTTLERGHVVPGTLTFSANGKHVAYIGVDAGPDGQRHLAAYSDGKEVFNTSEPDILIYGTVAGSVGWSSDDVTPFVQLVKKSSGDRAVIIGASVFALDQSALLTVRQASSPPVFLRKHASGDVYVECAELRGPRLRSVGTCTRRENGDFYYAATRRDGQEGVIKNFEPSFLPHASPDISALLENPSVQRLPDGRVCKLLKRTGTTSAHAIEVGGITVFAGSDTNDFGSGELSGLKISGNDIIAFERQKSRTKGDSVIATLLREESLSTFTGPRVVATARQFASLSMGNYSLWKELAKARQYSAPTPALTAEAQCVSLAGNSRVFARASATSAEISVRSADGQTIASHEVKGTIGTIVTYGAEWGCVILATSYGQPQAVGAKPASAEPTATNVTLLLATPTGIEVVASAKLADQESRKFLRFTFNDQDSIDAQANRKGWLWADYGLESQYPGGVEHWRLNLSTARTCVAIHSEPESYILKFAAGTCRAQRCTIADSISQAAAVIPRQAETDDRFLWASSPYGNLEQLGLPVLTVTDTNLAGARDVRLGEPSEWQTVFGTSPREEWRFKGSFDAGPAWGGFVLSWPDVMDAVRAPVAEAKKALPSGWDSGRR